MRHAQLRQSFTRVYSVAQNHGRNNGCQLIEMALHYHSPVRFGVPSGSVMILGVRRTTRLDSRADSTKGGPQISMSNWKPSAGRSAPGTHLQLAADA